MERSTLYLPEIAAYLERRAESVWFKIERADTAEEEAKLTREYNRLEASAKAIERIEEDFSRLTQIVRDYVQTEQKIAARYEAEFGRAS